MSAGTKSVFARPLGPADAADLAARLKALANPARLRLLSLIHQYGRDGATPTDLHPQMGLTQPTVSHHLAILAAAGLVTVYEVGRFRVHRVAYDDLAALAALLRPGRGGA